ncbi:MAG: metallophosphoesterase family protein [Planctomycetes bacterium]|nr:metallophosphoesterase family protein [Planctomycetota bacterium]
MFLTRKIRQWAWLPVLAGLVSLPLDFETSNAAELYRGPYLQLATPQSMVVVWRTFGKTNPSVRIGNSPEALDRTISGDPITLQVSADVKTTEKLPLLYKEPAADTEKRDARDDDPSTVANTYQYEALVAGLKPATRYYYAVYDGEQQLAGGDKQHYFVTSPPAGSDAKMRIWVVGDSGTGDHIQRDVHLAMQEFTQETKRDLDLYLHVGDMAYGDGTDQQFQHHFFDMYQPTLRNVVCWPTMGNHEGHTSRGISGFGPYYDAYVVPTAAEAGGLPSGTEAYYSFDIADVHFICLDSHDLDRSPDGAMAKWLVADLEEAQGDWLIAFWHHPPYTKGSHDSDREGQLIEMRSHFMPILEAAGVDIVLTGHSHIYERSMLIDGAYATPTTAEGVILDDGDGHPEGDGAYRKSAGLNPHEGTVAIVSGHGGAGLSRRGTMPIMREIIIEHGSVILDIDGETLTSTMINKNNVERDLFSIVKRGKVNITRVEKPWKPVHDFSKLTRFMLTWHEETFGQPPSKWTVAAGAPKAMLIEPQADGKAKQAVVSATDTASVVLFNEYNDHLKTYAANVEITAEKPAPAGLVFAYQDAQNYYTYRLNPETKSGEMLRTVDGNETVLTTKTIDLDFTKPVKVVMKLRRKRIEVQLQDDLEYTVNLTDRLPPGKIGLYVDAGGKAKYSIVYIERGSP